jgi:hypothetical protein
MTGRRREVWTAAEAQSRDHFTDPVGAERLTLIEEALAATAGDDINDPDFGRSDAVKQILGDAFSANAERVLDGDGITILSGFPVRDWPVEKLARSFRLIGATLGHGVSQSRMGDRLGHVTDVSGQNPNERGYRTSRELRLHTDANDIVGLMCVRTARTGGLSRLTSAVAIYEEMERRAPELLEVLKEGFPYHWRGEQPDGEPPITDYRIPVLSEVDGRVSCVYLYDHINWAAEDGHPFTERQQAALDLFDELASDPAFCLHFALEAGDAILFNNFTNLHARTSYEDHDDPAEKRLLLRLWLRADAKRPVVPEIDRFYPPDGIERQEGATTMFDRKRESAA